MNGRAETRAGLTSEPWCAMMVTLQGTSLNILVARVINTIFFYHICSGNLKGRGYTEYIQVFKCIEYTSI